MAKAKNTIGRKPPSFQPSAGSRPAVGNAVMVYLDQIKNHKILSREEEEKLGKMINSGKPNSKDAAVKELVSCNLKFAYNVASEFQGRGIDLEDLISEANIGLQSAAKRFNYNRGVKFITYANWWIRQRVIRYIQNNCRTVRVPIHSNTRITKLKRTEMELTGELGRQATSADIAAATGISEANIEKYLGQDIHTVSLDAPVDISGEGASLGEILPDPNALSPDEEVFRKITYVDITANLTKLPEREQRIIRARYGLDNEDPKTLETIAKEFNITRERIRQLQDGALKKLHRLVVSDTNALRRNLLGDAKDIRDDIEELGAKYNYKDLLPKIAKVAKISKISKIAKAAETPIQLTMNLPESTIKISKGKAPRKQTK